MSKRNLNLLIIALVIIIIAVFGFLYFRSKTNIPGNTNSTGSNFLSQFNPFGNGKTTTPVVTPPVNVSGYVPPATSATAKLIKISSMPIAGYTVFQQERLKNVPVPVPSLPAPAAPIPTSATGTVSTKAKVDTGRPNPRSPNSLRLCAMSPERMEIFMKHSRTMSTSENFPGRSYRKFMKLALEIPACRW